MNEPCRRSDIWRMKTAELMDRIAAVTTFVVNGVDGSQSRVEVRKHFTSTANPTGRYLATVADDSRADNLLRFPVNISTSVA